MFHDSNELYEERTFGETNSPQTIGVLILLFHIKKKFVITYTVPVTINTTFTK